MPVTHVTTTLTNIYRRSQRGYRCTYDCTDIYREDDDDDDYDDDAEGTKSLFKIAKNQICIS